MSIKVKDVLLNTNESIFIFNRCTGEDFGYLNKSSELYECVGNAEVKEIGITTVNVTEKCLYVAIDRLG